MNKENKIEQNLASFDFIDSIITKLYYEENLTDLIIEVDYFWTELDTNELIKLEIFNCLSLNYEIPENLYESNNGMLNLSQFTIQKIEFSIEKNPTLKIFTYDYNKPLLALTFMNLSISRSEIQP
ncbi:hypothetical protein ACWOFR_04370 [Carnobacterium gallinarum]|uniref:hypothetical protein n=1 Tax=Carnobacterium gallinarum TaxID=2749 RepID=UPI00068EE09B|nr:hypothetical protein [Carnobacterium gallinarum]